MKATVGCTDSYRLQVRILQLLDQSSSTHHITHVHIRMCIEKMGLSNLVDSFRTTKPQQNLPYIRTSHYTICIDTRVLNSIYVCTHGLFMCVCVPQPLRMVCCQCRCQEKEEGSGHAVSVSHSAHLVWRQYTPHASPAVLLPVDRGWGWEGITEVTHTHTHTHTHRHTHTRTHTPLRLTGPGSCVLQPGCPSMPHSPLGDAPGRF